ncbi:Degenerin mec-4 like protein [Argiope bruennichi]|uniref:Degenerin mec-4 like protein n=1 Tax=Argiope bruennichi TaxID=94029 RepID=A0A8T0E1M2_ARGBR|nr:Degenerin mec-4 like protein [Argiope bruennichi]
MESKFRKVSFWRTKARFLFRILLAVGFLVQSWKFVEMYFQYPSTVELEVVQPSEVEMPAFTVCNINEIRSTPYCETYSEDCGSPDSDPEFCMDFHEYCHLVNNSKQVSRFRDVSRFRHLSRFEQQMFGHQYESFVSMCTVETDDEETNCTSDPILIPALSFSYEIPFNCYMMYSLHEKPDEEPLTVPVSTQIHLRLNLEVSEYHPSHLSRGAQLSIHSPYHVPSPISEGLFLNMGTVYRIYVRLAEKVLLPPPYKSSCTDYLTQWKENGGKGPVTEKMCKEKCKLEMSLRLYGCAERRIDYPHNETICEKPIPNFAKIAREECVPGCTSPCRMRRYEVQVQEANSEGSRRSCAKAAESDLSCATLVHIIFENLEITTFTYTPRFEPIGILSFIGGYVGLWLGISLLTVPLFSDKAFFRHLSRYEQQVFGHQYRDLVNTCTIETDDEETECSSEPVLVPALSFSYEVPFNCFMIYSLHKKPNGKPLKVPVSTKFHLSLNLEVSEYHPSHLSRGAQLSIHSPYHVPSPVSEGLFLNMGTVYRIYVRLAEKNLLPPPYKSNCINYEKQWKENGGTGPVTEKMCKEKCKLEKSLDAYGCAERRIDYPHNKTICANPIFNFGRNTSFQCAKSCSSPCRMRRYEVQVQEADSEGSRMCYLSSHHFREFRNNDLHLYSKIRASWHPEFYRRLRGPLVRHLSADSVRFPGDVDIPLHRSSQKEVEQPEGEESSFRHP